MTNTIYEAMTDEMTWLGRVLWPLTFGVAYCVTGLFMVVNEKLLKVERVRLFITIHVSCYNWFALKSITKCNI